MFVLSSWTFCILVILIWTNITWVFWNANTNSEIQKNSESHNRIRALVSGLIIAWSITIRSQFFVVHWHPSERNPWCSLSSDAFMKIQEAPCIRRIHYYTLLHIVACLTWNTLQHIQIEASWGCNILTIQRVPRDMALMTSITCNNYQNRWDCGV